MRDRNDILAEMLARLEAGTEEYDALQSVIDEARLQRQCIEQMIVAARAAGWVPEQV